MLFNELQLIEPVLEALIKEGYANPTPIQEKSIPVILEKRDLKYIACINRFILHPVKFYWGDIETNCLKDSDSVPPPPRPK